MAGKNYKFDTRITTSGSSGVALYLPASIVKLLDLKDKKNYKIPCILDAEGDITIFVSKLAGEEDEE